MSFETYEASHITPQYTLLEKLNAILGFLKAGKLTARFYMYEGLYNPEETRYDKQYAIGIDEDIGSGDVLVFQNRYLAVIDHLDGDYIVISGATDIVSSVGHNYKHVVEIRVYKGTINCNTFKITVISSTSQIITSYNSIAFKNNASYLAMQTYYTNTDELNYIDIPIDGQTEHFIPLLIVRERIASTSPNAGFIYLIDSDGKIVINRYLWTSGEGATGDNISLRVVGDSVVEI